MGIRHGRQLGLPIVSVLVILALNFSQIVGQTGPLRTSLPADFLRRRNLLEPSKSAEFMTQIDNTVRVDPLNNLKQYRGGYDITSKHYWSSIIFTGIYGYTIGVWWLLVGLIYGGFLLVKIYCCRTTTKEKLKRRASCHKKCYLWSILFAVFFTILAIAASGLVLGGNARFNARARTVVNIIIDTANKASRTIHNTTGAMKDMVINLEETDQNTNQAINFLTSTSNKLDAEAGEIQRQAQKNRRLIDQALTMMYVITTVTISLSLVAVIALLVCGVLRFRRTLYLLITFCWILATLCWLLFGVYFFLEKFASDTCTALESFQQNPYNNSLSPILPCDELLSAQPILFEVSEGVYNIVTEVNANISLLQMTSYPNLPFVCNPFSGPPNYHYLSGYCPANTIHIGDIPKVLKLLACSDSGTGNCVNGGLSNGEYKTVEAYTNSIQNLLQVYPGMENLVECQSVKDAFFEILTNHCKPLKKYVHIVYAALLFLSTIMVVLVLTWTARAHHEEEVHAPDNSSVKPDFVPEKAVEFRTMEVIEDRSRNPCAV